MKLPAALLCWCALLPGAALAHEVGLSRSSWKAEPGRVTGTLVLAGAELNALSAEALGKAVAEGVAVAGCSLESRRAQPVEKDGVEVVLVFACAAEGGGEVSLEALLARLGEGHRHLVEVAGGELLLSRARPRFALAEVAGAGRSTWDLVQMGGVHILEGPDHLLFLLGLLLGVRRLREVLLVATAFTLGHSVTLSVATLGWAVPPARVVEPLIALSLVWVGVENLWRREPRGRWRVAAAFGLVHGFGFASALRELALPEARLGWALFGFNVGVELGQLLALAPLVPLLALLRRREQLERLSARVLSVGVAGAGLVWFVVRVAGL